MEIVLSGDMYDEKISVKYDDMIIYNGYVDNLVTSKDVDSDVELKLNYSNRSNQSNVIARRLGEEILWIPNIKYCFKEKYKYIPIIFSVAEFKKLWDSMRYNFQDDINKIKEVTNEEVMLTWYITSNIRESTDSIDDYANILSSKFICTDIDGENINKQILKLFNYNEILDKINLVGICEGSNNIINANIYLDDNIEWDAIKIADETNIYLNLCNKKYIPMNFK
ncbi:hypothetical protein FDB15_14145 [Clostridium botulinum]|uniref:hypothetical protein n=1 Tax=unclassified Clostridium TaxID=2614128 RepID=UPI000506879A|nr:MULTISPECIES: hypothetical protein [unclassified Clostridium]AIY79419.1 hypothetical protein U728_1555 [Clostridium botulinum 202F]KAI3346689.1 hypothetical protein CIT17_06895 [Clostridium botulinum]KFX53791.1 hypothetical protein KU40_17640 [Clostridium botulinum]KON13955.1 hypothetical protein ACP50_07810 [Clostridium botulinum]MBY6780029.1 hypothetical protein [Clostridium botulinum]